MAVGDVAQPTRSPVGGPGRQHVTAAGEAVLDPHPLETDGSDRERIRIVEEDLRTEQPPHATLRADVGEDTVHRLLGLPHRVAGHRLADAAAGAPVRAGRVRIALHPGAVQGVETTHVIEAGDMVHVRMGQHDGVHPVNAVLDAREAQLWWRVDQEARLAGAHVRATSATAVARVGRGAHGARAADLRHADTRSRSQEPEAHPSVTLRSRRHRHSGTCASRGRSP